MIPFRAVLSWFTACAMFALVGATGCVRDGSGGAVEGGVFEDLAPTDATGDVWESLDADAAPGDLDAALDAVEEPDLDADAWVQVTVDEGSAGSEPTTDSAPPAVCGNGRIEDREECDDGNDDTGDSCVACRAPKCGDGFLWRGHEECDDGRGTERDNWQGVPDDLDGCTAICRYSCRTDAECDNGLLCDGVEHCSSEHRCVSTPAPDGTACGAGRVCRSGQCSLDTCGNRVIDAGEECDDGNNTSGDACSADCTAPCRYGVDVEQVASCTFSRLCDPLLQARVTGPRPVEGERCERPSGFGRCEAGVCVAARCGDAAVDWGTGELCDDGNSDDSDGCTRRCVWGCRGRQLCQSQAWSPCRLDSYCDPIRHLCPIATPLANGVLPDLPRSADGRVMVCFNGEPTPSHCGDGYVDPSLWEQCEPPAARCSPASCTWIVDGCGDGVVSGAEECDDGNSYGEDGCSDRCKVEQFFRASAAQISGVLGGCDLNGDLIPDNAVGRALSLGALVSLNDVLRTTLDRMDNNILFQLMDLEDRVGQNDTSLRIAVFSGLERAFPAWGYPDPVRWWGDGVDFIPFRRPAYTFWESVTGGVLRPSRSEVVIRIWDGGHLRTIPLRWALLQGRLVPNAARTAVASIGTASARAKICGAVPAANLDRWVDVQGLPSSCGDNPFRSLLDVLALGCAGLGGVVVPTQPDADLGADGLYGAITGAPLADTDGDGIIDLCRDSSSGRVIRGTNCAQDPSFDDGYSIALDFAAEPARVLGVTF